MTIIREGLQSADLDVPVMAPILNLDFVNSKKLDPRITFTRATDTATYVGSDGYIKTAIANEPRFDHNPITGECKGLLIEESRTNYFPNTPNGYGGTVSTGTATGADGQTAQKFVPPVGTSFYSAIEGDNVTSGFYNFSLSSGETIDVSFSGYFASLGDGLCIPDIVIECSTATSDYVYAELNVDLSNGTIRSYGYSGGSGLSELIYPQITLMPFGMYKVTWTVRYTQGSTIRTRFGFYIQCRRKQAGGGVDGVFDADGTSGFQFSCIQYEIGSVPTSYIPTTTTNKTRNPDLVTMQGSVVADIFKNCRELSLQYSGDYNIDKLYWAINNTDQTEQIQLIYAGLPQFQIKSGTSSTYAAVFTVPSNPMNIICLMDQKSISMISNLPGLENYEYASKTDIVRCPDISQFSKIYIGQVEGYYALNGTVKRFVIYPRRLSNSQGTYLTAQNV